jgi:hypothetical protein
MSWVRVLTFLDEDDGILHEEESLPVLTIYGLTRGDIGDTLERMADRMGARKVQLEFKRVS